ncbi:MAG TPA: hypothetical protein VN451_10525 [Chitinophagaceae bacterium]|nr:hypothetical protein [Chitinophagaceae bacterium]
MEVHQHHGHIPMKKKWMEYVFQFFMLFLAVFLGMLAENKREHRIEGKREKEYIHSLIEDLRIDIATINTNLESYTEQYKNIDSLQQAFIDYIDHKPGAEQNCYYFNEFIKLVILINFPERTITQLLSSGNMRLIRTSAVADNIMDYHSYVKAVDIQKQMYINYINRCTETMYNFFDITYLRKRISKYGEFIDDSLLANAKLLNTNPVEIKKFLGLIESAKSTIGQYKYLLYKLAAKAEALVEFLQKKYHLKK